MKITAFALLSILGVAAAGKPQLSISVRDGKFDGIGDGLDPTLKWEASSTSGDMDLSYGIESAISPTKDIASLPRNIWGKAKTEISGWGVSARAEVDAQDMKSADLEVDADNTDLDVSAKMTASAGSGFDVKTVEVTKGLDVDGARVTITPRFNIEDDERDVVVNYNNGDTDVKLTASQDAQEVEISHSTGKTNIKLIASVDAQEVTISQQIDDDNRVAPTINNDGDISIEWERRLGDDSSVTTTVKPNDSIDVEWQDDAWTANLNMPLDGTNINGANVSIKRDVEF
eukprot:CAMPEP_0119003030 /NCGR_PEP_ID=MMETSP1176-20130426/305_1 /TAXON_ID=265551 /ORGANISM="Synedropsis recta cf, Strain CCMP1620" /LENGTH=286 /DNA_ID=CAMNT_0006954589 /DNA_START=57 /DNA_END=917 /DNA_ORIENTATION=-